MRSLFFVASLAVMLIALPASAQLGPAGVPGAPGLAETDPSVKPTPPTQPTPPFLEETPRTTEATACNKVKNADKCKTHQPSKKKTRESCKGKTGKAHRQCLNDRKVKSSDCSKSREPARCEQFKKIQNLCKDKLGSEHSQCLRDNLVPQK